MVYVILSKLGGVSADDAAELVKRAYPEAWTAVDKGVIGFGSQRAPADAKQVRASADDPTDV